MSAPLPLAPDSRRVMCEVGSYRFGDVPRQRCLIRLIGEIRRLRLVAPEPDLDQGRWHLRAAQDREIGLLPTAIRARMDIDQASLNRLGQIARFTQMLVLRHVGDDEAERIAFGSVGASLELD